MQITKRIYKPTPDSTDTCIVEITMRGRTRRYTVANRDFRIAVENAGQLEEAPAK